MKNKYKLIIFDLDGTLVDSRTAILAGMQDMAAALGIPPAVFLEKTVNIGLPMSDILRELGINDIEKARSVYRETYRAYTHLELAFPGVPELLGEIHGRLPLSIATNKAYEGSLRTLGNAGILGYFDFIASLDQGIAKPDPDAFIRICAHYRKQGLAYSGRECLMVGDSPIDCEFARNAGIDFVFAQWGFHDGSGLGQGVRCLDYPGQLLDIVF